MKFIQNNLKSLLFCIFCWISQSLLALGYSASPTFNADTQKLTLWEYPVLINSWLTLSGWRLAINLINPSYPLDVNGYINTSSGFCISWNCISSWNSLLPNGSNTWVTLRWTGTGWADSNSGDILVNGINIGRGNGSIISNTVLGYSALSWNVSGHSNTAIGYWVLMSTTNWNYNTAIWFWALTSNIDGSWNVSIGYQALSNNLSGSYNTAWWFQSLWMNTLGSWNTAFWNSALILNTTWNYNTALWRDSLRNNRVWSSNIAIWHQSLFSNHTGSNSIAIWHQASFQTDISSPYPNIVIWYQSLYGGSFTALLNTAYNNVAIGYQTMYGTTGTPSTGYNNTAIWNGALNKNTSWRGNSTLGYRTLFSNTTGIYNTAIWDSALYSNTVGTYNTAIWRNALYENTTGDYNFALWFDALSMNDVGSYNTAIGSWALWSNTSGLNNTAIGWSALNMNDIWDDNVAIGESALMNNVIWHSNTAIGNWAWSAINGNSWVVDGFSNTFIGHYATAYTGNIENATAIGANALITDSNTVIIGSISWSNNATETVNVWIWTSSPSERLEVAWNIRATAYLYSSDERLKKDIYSITGALDKVLKLDGVHFTWIETQDESYGFIAQSIEKVFPELVATSSKTGMKSVQYANLLAPVINAMKELYELHLSQAKRIDEQERRIQDMEKQIQALMNQINAQNITQ